MTIAAGPVRLYLTGRLGIEHAGALIAERRLGSRQARLLFARLALERAHAASHEDLAELLWGADAPPRWHASLKALVSKLRNVLDPIAELTLESHFGCYQLSIAGPAWIDWEAAVTALDDAEGAVRAKDPKSAWGAANVAIAIARRGFLPGEHGRWVEARRHALGDVLLRGLECYTDVALATGQPELAAQAARNVIDREPFRESGYQRLMKALAALGNRAEALRVYHHCRKLLDEELAVKPAPETEAVFLQLLKD